ncbi:ABC transporter substrate-binding protein [Shouchella miscanthi]|uniref:ABC transporter substrate-binding protein n=1 Tax=Shouchella miscanthi TaxID=2598861 RepID=A0ABU6NKX0_9BACI|nr:ABC transporter substrate-binding protein [Shouchella miscanthi]
MGKHYLSLLACLSGIAFLSACGDSQGASGSEEKVTIEYWHVNNEDWGGKAIKEMVREFNRSQDRIEVKESFQPGNYQGLLQNAQAALSGGNPPDVAQIGYNYISYVDQNVPYVPVAELAATDDEGEAFLNESYLENIKQLGYSSDKEMLAGLPYALSNPIMYVNADLLREAGWDVEQLPQTWDEMQEMAQLVQENTGEYGLYVQQPPDSWAEYALVRSNGGDFLNYNGNQAVSTIASEESIEVFDMLGGMIQDKQALHVTWEEGIQAFVTGRVGMMMTTVGRRTAIEEQSNFDLRSVEIPTFGEKERQVAAGGNALFSFAQDPDKQAAAWEFMKYLSSPEAMKVWVEGTGYLPPVVGLAEDPDTLGPFFEENPIMQTANAQMDSIVPWINFPGANGLQAEQAILDARDKIFHGEDVEAVLQETEEKINSYIQ